MIPHPHHILGSLRPDGSTSHFLPRLPAYFDLSLNARSTPLINASITPWRPIPLHWWPTATANAAARLSISVRSPSGAPLMTHPLTCAATKSAMCAGVTRGLERPNVRASLPMAEAVRVVSVMCSVLRRFPTLGVDALGVKKGRLRRDAVEGDMLLKCSRSARVRVVITAVRGIEPHTAWECVG
jgi:hypothetical protein